ncbi:MAG: hypothetical protein AB2792_21805 [Candidatus Thiodiazotropha sp.]|jgi:hypothetical protein
MRIVISDSSCLIDLHKGGLLSAIFDLPYSFAIPQPLFDEELLSIPDKDKKMLVAMGMEVTVLPGEQVMQAQLYLNQNRPLALNDCFALVLAEDTDDSILFTGDRPLKMLAESKNIETHGVIWAVDMLQEHTDIDTEILLAALELFLNDPLVRLPEEDLKKRIRMFKKKK